MEEIIDLLINHTELSLIDIANKYGVTQDTILRISTGRSYINPDLKYPLRRNNHDAARKTKVEDYFSSIQELLALKKDLKYSWWLKIENGDLYNKYNITKKILLAINHGKMFQDIGDYTYPIRKSRVNTNLTKEDVLEILNSLKNTSESMTNIGKAYNISRTLVSNINMGISYPIKDYKYPAR